MSKINICVVTGTRAEYGLLFWLMKELDLDPEVELQIIATGTHLSDRFGHTIDTIEADGFQVTEAIDILDDNDSDDLSMAQAVGRAVPAIASAFKRLVPDIVVILGDRFEMLAVAQAALLMRLPLAHIHGGEITEGNIDESIRHAITKMAQIHFASTEPYRQRILQLGELPENVHTVGAPGLENLTRLKLLSKQQLADQLGLELSNGPVILMTYHPVTLDDAKPKDKLNEVLAAFDAFPDARLILTGPNADVGGREILDRLEEYTAENRKRAAFSISLGQIGYLSALKHSDVVVGNSSSAIIEAPSAGTVSVNIGDRQKGRLRASTVIDCEESADQIIEAIHQALSKDMKVLADKKVNVYGQPNGIAVEIKNTLKNTDLKSILRKPFQDRIGI